MKINRGRQVLYATFASPWAEEPATPEPQFNLPSCYYLQPPPLKPMHLKNFQVETLFYIFYSMPQDVLQASVVPACRVSARETVFIDLVWLWFLVFGWFLDQKPRLYGYDIQARSARTAEALVHHCVHRKSSK